MKYSTALRNSQDPDRKFDSQLNQGRIDKAYENLEVRVLHSPNEQDWKLTATIAGAGHSGAGFNPLQYIDSNQIDELIASDLWKGGLGQVKESDTVTFLIWGLSRGVTHEMVRNRKAWFVQQTMRHSRMHKANMRMPEYYANASEALQRSWIESVKNSLQAYEEHTTGADVPYQDARTVLPIATETWIISGYPVRAWLEEYAYRACTLFYPETRWIWHEMKRKLMEVCPWIAEQAKLTCELTKVCEYNGVENTHEMCELPWSHIRRWQSAAFSMGETKDVRLSEHNSSTCELCTEIPK